MNTEVVRQALEARRDELRDELEVIDEELDRLGHEQAQADAEFLREAKRELDALIADAWGPPIDGRRRP